MTSAKVDRPGRPRGAPRRTRSRSSPAGSPCFGTSFGTAGFAAEGSPPTCPRSRCRARLAAPVPRQKAVWQLSPERLQGRRLERQLRSERTSQPPSWLSARRNAGTTSAGSLAIGMSTKGVSGDSRNERSRTKSPRASSHAHQRQERHGPAASSSTHTSRRRSGPAVRQQHANQS